jgi:DNA polymerase
MRLLRHGLLEVETDLLLGVEEVLLPEGAVVAHPRQPLESGAVETKPTPSAPRGFEAALFAPKAGAPRPSVEQPPVQPPASRVASAAPEPRRSTVGELHGPQSSLQRQSGEGAAAQSPLATKPAEAIVDAVAIPSGATKGERLAALEAEHARACPHCTTATAHTRLVFGEGNPDAELVFIGEAPGETEDQLGRPFVGKAGEKLDEMIRAMGFRREDVYIANVLKSRPPDNRTPLAHEVAACGPYLLAQLSIVRPRAIVTLGGPASKLLLASELGITRLRGIFGSVRLRGDAGAHIEVPVMPTYHPAYLLRNYTPETRAQMWSDLKQVLTTLGRAAPSRSSTGTASSTNGD